MYAFVSSMYCFLLSFFMIALFYVKSRSLKNEAMYQKVIQSNNDSDNDEKLDGYFGQSLTGFV